MEAKINNKGLSRKVSLPIYFILWLIIAIIGFAEGGIAGFAIGLASGVICSILTITGLIPFVGIFVYMFGAGWFNVLLTSSGIEAPIALSLSFWGFFVFALVGYVITSIIAGLLILKGLLG